MTFSTAEINYGIDAVTKYIWGREERIVVNTELKEMLEAYKTRNKEQCGSGLGDLANKKSRANATLFKPLTAAQEEELPLQIG